MGSTVARLICAAGGLFAVSLHSQELVRSSMTPSDSEIERVIISTDGLPAYDSPNAYSATKTDTPTLDVPQTIQVIPRQLIDDQRDLKLYDAFRNVASVNANSSIRNFDQYRIRGYGITGGSYLDGLLVDRSVNFQEDLFGLDRIEILEGPSSVLYGEGPPGGLVNLISKTPRKEMFTTLSLGGGSYGEFEAGLDTNMVFNRAGTVYGRVNALYRQIGEFTDGLDPSLHILVAPSLTVDLGKNTKIILLSQYLREWQRIGYPLPAVGTVLPNVNGRISIYRNIGEPDTYPNEDKAWRVQLGYQLEHRFNDVFTLRQNLRFGYHEATYRGVFPDALEADQRTLERDAESFPERYTTLGVDTTLVARFATGRTVKHTALVGVNLEYLRDHIQFQAGSIDSLDVFHPKYGARPFDFGLVFDYLQHEEDTGIYFQDQIAFFDRLYLVGGGRGDFVHTDVYDKVAASGLDQYDAAFTPRAGIVYEFIPKQASVYFSYSRSFVTQPINETDLNGNQLQPERGEQYEIGAKAQAFGGRLSALLAAYHAIRTNVPVADPSNPLVFDVVGEQRDRGIEFSGNFTPRPGWDVVASYSYVDARVTAGTAAQLGKRPRGVPENTWSLWTRYTVQSGPVRGLGGGLGLRYLTEREGDSTNSFALPSYGSLDLALYYDRGRFHGQVNVSNVTNERYFAGAFSRLSVNPGYPINVSSRFTWSF